MIRQMFEESLTLTFEPIGNQHDPERAIRDFKPGLFRAEQYGEMEE